MRHFQVMHTRHDYHVVWFVLGTFLISWGIWIPLAVLGVNVRSFPWFYMMAVGGAAPSAVGLLFIVRTREYAPGEFVRSLFSFRSIGRRNMALMIVVIALPFVLSLLLDSLLFGHPLSATRFASTLTSPMSLILVLASLAYGGPITEEFGWRGFAARRLLPRLGLLRAGILLGVIWSIWHYPLLFLSGQYEIDNYFIYIPIHLLKHVALSVIILYFYQAAGRMVLMAMLIHFLSNAFVNVFYPITLTANAMHTVLLSIIAVVLLRLASAAPPAQRRSAFSRLRGETAQVSDGAAGPLLYRGFSRNREKADRTRIR